MSRKQYALLPDEHERVDPETSRELPNGSGEHGSQNNIHAARAESRPSTADNSASPPTSQAGLPASSSQNSTQMDYDSGLSTGSNSSSAPSSQHSTGMPLSNASSPPNSTGYSATTSYKSSLRYRRIKPAPILRSSQQNTSSKLQSDIEFRLKQLLAEEEVEINIMRKAFINLLRFDFIENHTVPRGFKFFGSFAFGTAAMYFYYFSAKKYNADNYRDNLPDDTVMFCIWNDLRSDATYFFTMGANFSLNLGFGYQLSDIIHRYYKTKEDLLILGAKFISKGEFLLITTTTLVSLIPMDQAAAYFHDNDLARYVNDFGVTLPQHGVAWALTPLKDALKALFNFLLNLPNRLYQKLTGNTPSYPQNQSGNNAALTKIMVDALNFAVKKLVTDILKNAGDIDLVIDQAFHDKNDSQAIKKLLKFYLKQIDNFDESNEKDLLLLNAYIGLLKYAFSDEVLKENKQKEENSIHPYFVYFIFKFGIGPVILSAYIATTYVILPANLQEDPYNFSEFYANLIGKFLAVIGSLTFAWLVVDVAGAVGKVFANMLKDELPDKWVNKNIYTESLERIMFRKIFNLTAFLSLFAASGSFMTSLGMDEYLEDLTGDSFLGLTLYYYCKYLGVILGTIILNASQTGLVAKFFVSAGAYLASLCGIISPLKHGLLEFQDRANGHVKETLAAIPADSLLKVIGYNIGAKDLIKTIKAEAEKSKKAAEDEAKKPGCLTRLKTRCWATFQYARNGERKHKPILGGQSAQKKSTCPQFNGCGIM